MKGKRFPKKATKKVSSLIPSEITAALSKNLPDNSFFKSLLQVNK
jgi:hypothetical protein